MSGNEAAVSYLKMVGCFVMMHALAINNFLEGDLVPMFLFYSIYETEMSGNEVSLTSENGWSLNHCRCMYWR